jgi:hypothetical protein
METGSRTLNYVGFLLIFVFGAICGAHGASEPAIIITNLPAYGSSANLGGTVADASPSKYAVAVFIYIPGTGWWSKPTCPGQPLTPIEADGAWVTDITTGGLDQQATRIAALLVGTNYNQPCVLGEAVLSSNIYTQTKHT